MFVFFPLPVSGTRPAVLNRRGYLEIKNYYQPGEEELEANEEVLLLRQCRFLSPLKRLKLDGTVRIVCVDILYRCPSFLYSGYQRER